MEEIKQEDLFCNQCCLQFYSKSVYDLHLSLVHSKSNISKACTNAKLNRNREKIDVLQTKSCRKVVFDPQISSNEAKMKCKSNDQNKIMKSHVCLICNGTKNGKYDRELGEDGKTGS